MNVRQMYTLNIEESKLKTTEKIWDLFILDNNKWVEIDTGGEYRHKDRYLNNYDLAKQLNGEKSCGVFSAPQSTKFISFDVDSDNNETSKWMARKVIYTLRSLGVPTEAIHCIDSSGKGYHIDLYFEEPVYNNKIEDFYKIVIELADVPKRKVELRPTPTQAIRLPLSRNFNNERKQFSYYVDWMQDFKPIVDFNHIFTIKEISTDIIYTIVYDEIRLLKTYNKREKKIKKVSNTNIEKLEKEGLTELGTRHDSLNTLGRHYKAQGLSKSECIESLTSWMEKESARIPKLFKAEREEWEADIRRIVDWCFDNYNGSNEAKDALISAQEMAEVITVGKGKLHLIAFQMLVYSKRYADDKGEFFLSYEKMREESKIGSKSTISGAINALEEVGFLEIVSRKKYSGGIYCETNRYRVKIPIEDGDFLVVKECSNLDKVFYDCLYHYRKDLLKLMAPTLRKKIKRVA